MDKEKKIVLFDGVCNLCSQSIQFIIRHDRKNQFLFGTLQGMKAKEYLQKFNLPLTDWNSFVLIEKNKPYTRSTAVLRLMWHLGSGWRFFYLFIIFPKFIRDGMYRMIARKRYKWFGKKDACWIPAPEIMEKFLD